MFPGFVIFVSAFMSGKSLLGYFYITICCVKWRPLACPGKCLLGGHVNKTAGMQV